MTSLVFVILTIPLSFWLGRYYQALKQRDLLRAQANEVEHLYIEVARCKHAMMLNQIVGLPLNTPSDFAN